MSFGLSPTDYFSICREAYDEFCRDPVSLRKAISACIFTNHLPDYLFAEYGKTSSAKLRGAIWFFDYRACIERAEPALGVIRDLCDYGKDGPVLRRKNGGLGKNELTECGEIFSGPPGEKATSSYTVDSLVVIKKDGSMGLLESYLQRALYFWRKEFDDLAL